MAGYVGQVATDVLNRYEIKEENTFLFELDMEFLLESILKIPSFEAFSRFPAVYRDISLVTKKEIESGTIRRIIEQEGGELAESIELYDVFEGGKIHPSERALTFRLCYRSKEGTLDGKEVNRLHERIIKRIQEKTGGRLREA